jgi:uncharacterized UPF0160 family protein
MYAYLPRGIIKLLHGIRKFFPFHSRHKDIEKDSFKIFKVLNFLQQLDEIMRGIGKIALSIKVRERLTAPLRGLPQSFASIPFILSLES